MHKITHRDANALLEHTAELVVALRSWGFHLSSSCLQPRNADTGKIIDPDSNPLQDIEDIILRIRRKK